MKKLLTLVVLGTLLSSASAQVFLSVDFNGFYYSATESGFTGISAGSTWPDYAGSYPATIGSYTVDLASTTTVGQYQNGPFVPTVGAGLYKDYAYANAGVLTVTVGGLANNTPYEFRSFNWLGNAGTSSTLTFTPINGTTGGSPTYTGSFNGSTDITSINQFSTLMDLTSNGSGQIVFTLSGSAYNTSIINGFTIATVTVPEPSTIASMGLGLAFLALRLRRRMA